MKRFFRANKGSLTIEASLSLSIFLFAFVTLLSFINIARTESRIQHAINQSAKELSYYLYVFDQAVVLEERGVAEEDIEVMVDNLIQMNQFIGEGGYPPQFAETNQQQMQVTASSSTPAEVIGWLTEVALNDPASITSNIVAETLASQLVPKYLYPGSTMAEIDQQLKSLHVVDGLSGLDFKQSSLLADGESINIVVEYRIGSMIPSFFNKDIVISQTASTATWTDERQIITSKWQLNNVERGQAFLAEIRAENPDTAVKPGQGIDLYNNGVCTSIFTVNLFTPSYSGVDSASNYTLNHSRVRSTTRTYAAEAVEQTLGLGDRIEMLDGQMIEIATPLNTTVLMIVPEEAQRFQTELETIATEIELEKGVTIEWQYREPALL